MNIPKTAKLGLACVAALSYSDSDVFAEIPLDFQKQTEGIPGREGFVPDI